MIYGADEPLCTRQRLRPSPALSSRKRQTVDKYKKTIAQCRRNYVLKEPRSDEFLTSAATHIEVHRGVLKSGMINAQQKNRLRKRTKLGVNLLGL